jgi:hypothetical protein
MGLVSKSLQPEFLKWDSPVSSLTPQTGLAESSIMVLVVISADGMGAGWHNGLTVVPDRSLLRVIGSVAGRSLRQNRALGWPINRFLRDVAVGVIRCRSRRS